MERKYQGRLCRLKGGLSGLQAVQAQGIQYQNHYYYHLDILTDRLILSRGQIQSKTANYTRHATRSRSVIIWIKLHLPIIVFIRSLIYTLPSSYTYQYISQTLSPTLSQLYFQHRFMLLFTLPSRDFLTAKLIPSTISLGLGCTRISQSLGIISCTAPTSVLTQISPNAAAQRMAMPNDQVRDMFRNIFEPSRCYFTRWCSTLPRSLTFFYRRCCFTTCQSKYFLGPFPITVIQQSGCCLTTSGITSTSRSVPLRQYSLPTYIIRGFESQTGGFDLCILIEFGITTSFQIGKLVLSLRFSLVSLDTQMILSVQL